MSIASWILAGGLVGLLGDWLIRGQFPGGTLGRIATGAAGGFVGGGLFAVLGERSVSGFDPVTVLTAPVGAAVLLAAMYKADAAERRTH